MFRAGTWHLRNSNSGGAPDISFAWGGPDDVPVVGDWDGNGTTTIGVRRGSTWLLRNSNSPGGVDTAFDWGWPTDAPVVGDWDGNSTSTIGVFRSGTWFLRNALGDGPISLNFGWGGSGQIPLVGDWDGDAKHTTTVGIRAGDRFYQRNSNASGPIENTFSWGQPSSVVAGEPTLKATTLVSGLSNPWDLAFAPDGAMFFTQRPGVLSVRLPDGTVRNLNADLSDLFVAGESGLESIEVDPAFASNRRVYTCQAKTGGPAVQVLAWTVDSGYTTLTRVANPLVGGMPLVSGRHGGCRIRIGGDGMLWIGTGDAATGTIPQDLTSLGGKVLRVDRFSGAGAADNPFAGSANANTRRIYTYGHRNVQGLA